MSFFHRRVEIAVRALGEAAAEARAVVEDDFHHFRVTIRARDGRVSEALSEAPRFPRTLCPAAGARLSELVGLQLTAASAAVAEVVDARQQCTHQFDLASLAVAALAQGRPHRVYEAEIPDAHDGGMEAVLKRDGEVVLSWKLHKETILEPEPYAGRSIGSGFTAFARSLPLKDAEAALVLRRAVYVAGGRRVDRSGKSTMAPPIGGCWVYQPERLDQSERSEDSTFDFTGRAHELARDDAGWLRFETAG